MKNPDYLYVCDRCLIAIESHEGHMFRKIYNTDTEDNADCTCDWCGENGFDELWKIVKGY